MGKGAGTPVKLEPRVLRLLATLVQRADAVVTKHELLTSVWDSRMGSENVLTPCASEARRELAVLRGRLRSWCRAGGLPSTNCATQGYPMCSPSYPGRAT